MSDLEKTVSDEVSKLEGEAKSVEDDGKKLFAKESVDLKDELPGLIAKTGVNTSDVHSVHAAVLAVVVSLLKEYGPDALKAAMAALEAAA